MTTRTPPSPRKVRCPACGALTVYDVGNPWRPFCSERCRQRDLGAWASEDYRVPARSDEGSDDDADVPGDEGRRPH